MFITNVKVSFVKIYTILSFLIIINFFLTSNPYAALHSGAIGILGINSTYFIAPAYVVLFTLIVTVLKYQQNIVFDFKLLLGFILMFITGIETSTFFEEANTYFYNFLSFLLCFSAAFLIGNNSNVLKVRDVKRFLIYLNLIFVAGITLAILYPYKFGVLPFGFSRVSRGEVTLWNFTALPIIYSSLVITVHYKFKIKYPFIIWVIMFITILSTASRAQSVLMSIPIILYLIILSKPIIKVFAFLTSILLIILYGNKIINFLLGNGNLTDVTNGRMQLWNFHWHYFLENPIFGNGAGFQTRYLYSGIADSEIGILKMLSEYGSIYGAIMISFIVISVFVAIRMLINIKNITFLDLFFSLTLISMLPNIIQSYSRILNVEDFLFWFSVFYLNFKKKSSLLPYLSIKKIKLTTH